MNAANRFAPAPVPAAAQTLDTPIYHAKGRIDEAHSVLHNALHTLDEAVVYLEKRISAALQPSPPETAATGNSTNARGVAGADPAQCRSPLADHLHATAEAAESAVDKVERLRIAVNNLAQRFEA